MTYVKSILVTFKVVFLKFERHYLRGLCVFERERVCDRDGVGVLDRRLGITGRVCECECDGLGEPDCE